MSGFILFILVPALAWPITLFVNHSGEISNFYVSLLFIVYLLSALIIYFKEDIKESKSWLTILYVIVPLGLFCSLIFFTSDWWEKGYKPKKETATLILYNESEKESIYSISIETDEKYTSIIDTIYGKIHPLPENASKEVEYGLAKLSGLHKYQFNKIKLVPGTYKIKLITQENKSGEYHTVYYNREELELKAKDNIFICYGGKNLFQFMPGSGDASMMTGYYTDKGNIQLDVSMNPDEPASKKE